MHKKSSSKLKIYLSCLAIISLSAIGTQTASAQEPFLAEIKMFGGNFAPRGYAFTDGQLLAISQYSALFSLLGTTYGGDGRTTFALPDLRGRVPMHAGNGPGLTQRRLGEKSGVENVTLTIAQMPSHNHTATASSISTLNATSANGDKNVPTGNVLADDGNDRIYSDQAPDVTMSASAVNTTTTVTVNNNGGNQSHTNVQPFTVVNFIIALQGIFPSRN